MAFNKIHWQVKFRNINETPCTINIYDEYYGGQPVQLLGADTPFYFEEDNDKNLAESVIRYRTGYLNIVNAPADIYPVIDGDRYVEAYVDTRLIFTGYIQAQEFQTKWAAGPQVAKLPVVSPLGLAEGMKFDLPSTHGTVTIGHMMRLALAKLDPFGRYTSILTPALKQTDGTDLQTPWALTISTLAFTPLNDDYVHNDPAETAYEPRTLDFLLDGICKCFRWVLHDSPGTLTFADVSHNGYYMLTNVSALESAPGGKTYSTKGDYTQDLDSYLTHWDKGSKTSVIRPYKNITITNSGEEKSIQPDLVRTKNNGSISNNAVFLFPVTDEFGGMMPGMEHQTCTAEGVPTQYGTSGVAYVKNDKEVEMLFCKYNSAYGTSNNPIFIFRTHEQPEDAGMIKGTFTNATKLSKLNDWEQDKDFIFRFYIKAGNKYNTMGGTGGWVNYIVWQDITINKENKEFKITWFNTPPCDTLEFGIALRETNMTDGILIGIKDVEIQMRGSDEETLHSKYIDPYRGKLVIAGDSKSPQDLGITETLNTGYNNTFLMKGKKFVTGTYQYLLKAQDRFEGKFRNMGKLLTPYLSYIELWRWINADRGWRWRLISYSYNMREDIATIVLHHSVIFDTGGERPLYAIDVTSDRPTYDDYLFRVTASGTTKIYLHYYPEDTTTPKNVTWTQDADTDICEVGRDDDGEYYFEVFQMPDVPTVVNIRFTSIPMPNVSKSIKILLMP